METMIETFGPVQLRRGLTFGEVLVRGEVVERWPAPRGLGIEDYSPAHGRTVLALLRERAGVAQRACADMDAGDIVEHGSMTGGPAAGGMRWEPQRRRVGNHCRLLSAHVDDRGRVMVAVAEATDADLAHAPMTARIAAEWRARHPQEERVRGWSAGLHRAAWARATPCV